MVNLAVKEEWLDRDLFEKYKLKFEKKDRGYLTQNTVNDDICPD